MYRPWSIKEKARIAHCQSEVTRLVELEKWERALEIARELLDKWHVEHPHLLNLLRYHDVHSWKLEEETPSKLMVQAYVSAWEDDIQANVLALTQKAIDRGHIFALYWYGLVLGADHHGPFHAIILPFVRRAAQANCQVACRLLGRIYHTSGSVNLPHRHFYAALWYSRGNSDRLDELVLDRPVQVCPFGIWRPTLEYHQFVPSVVHDAMVTWMRVAKRVSLCRGVALIIVEYVCTNGANEWTDMVKWGSWYDRIN